MALNKGNVGEVTVVRDSKMYTGILPWKVIAINPKLAQLQALGINFQDEPEYKYDGKGPNDTIVPGIRIDVWMEAIIPITNEVVRAKASFYLEKQYRISQAGTSLEYLNAYNQNAWGTLESPPDFKWFKLEKVRKAYVGEESFTSFLINWMNVDRDLEFSIDNFTELVDGKLDEVIGLLPVYSEKNRVRAMLTVTEREGKAYHTIFTKFFARWNEESFTRWAKFFKKDTRNEPKNAVWSYAIEEYKPTTVKPDADPQPDAQGQAGAVPSTRKWA